jgi:hypothetical protein
LQNFNETNGKIYSLNGAHKGFRKAHNAARFKMIPKKDVLKGIHEQLIRGTYPGAIVANEVILLSRINIQTLRQTELCQAGIYISSRALKHMYDKRPAQEYDSLLKSIPQIIGYPDHIYRNKPHLEGFAFVKAIHGYSYMCPVKHIRDNQNKMCVVTAFSVKPGYMKDFKLLWSYHHS